MKKSPLVAIRLAVAISCWCLIAWSIFTQQTIGNEGSILKGPEFTVLERESSPAGFIMINSIAGFLSLIILFYPRYGLKREPVRKVGGSHLIWRSKGFFRDLFGDLDHIHIFIMVSYPVVIILANVVTLERFIWTSLPFGMIFLAHTGYMLFSYPKGIEIQEDEISFSYRLLPVVKIKSKEISGLRERGSSIVIDTGYTTSISIPIRLFSVEDLVTIQHAIERVQPNGGHND